MRPLIFTLIFLAVASALSAQSTGGSCPLNMDFEMGSTANWQCASGYVDARPVKNVVTNLVILTTTGVVKDRQTMIAKSNQLDKYGKFPMAPPDGSNYALKLGNDLSGGQSSAASYTFTVPREQGDFVLTYSYAVVFRDGQHWAVQQPRFLAKVFDIAANTYIDCAAAEYVTTADLPGFQRSAIAADVIYKSWSNVTLNFSAYKGKKLRIEFTAAGCTLGGHFCYAYVDINKTCTGVIGGADFCGNAAKVSLTGPGGYKDYKWYNASHTQVIGTGNPLVLTTPPADGTTLMLDLTPYPGFGCANTVTAVLHNHGPNLVVANPAPVCFPGKVNIANTSVASVSGTGVSLSYWKDAQATIPLTSPAAIAASGTYYIKATSDWGCTEIKPVFVIINPLPVLNITDPAAICAGGAIDLTSPAVTTGSTMGTALTYWKDAAATISLSNPSAIGVAGTYYIKSTNPSGCYSISAVHVRFYDLPVFSVIDPPAVCEPATVNLSSAVNTQIGDELSLTYWKDAAATQALSSQQVSASGTYYIKATNVHGCQLIKPVTVVVNPLPKLVINNPPDVCVPGRVDLSARNITAGSTGIASLSYWRDANATQPLNHYNAVADSGTYYIKALNAQGCGVVQPVLVNIHQLPTIRIIQPKSIYQPHTIDLTSAVDMNSSTANAIYTYWTNASLSTPVEHPKALTQTGTYYIKASNAYGCYTVAAVEVLIAPVPDILVPTGFTPLQLTNNKLYPFLKGIRTFKFFRIYNRWGNVVFEANDAAPDKGWDGVYKGAMSFLDTFTWVSEGYDYLGNLVHRSGNTVLLK